MASLAFEATCVGGERLPPIRSGRAAHYELVPTAKRSQSAAS